jgi:hypothetical protein
MYYKKIYMLRKELTYTKSVEASEFVLSNMYFATYESRKMFCAI